MKYHKNVRRDKWAQNVKNIYYIFIIFIKSHKNHINIIFRNRNMNELEARTWKINKKNIKKNQLKNIEWNCGYFKNDKQISHKIVNTEF